MTSYSVTGPQCIKSVISSHMFKWKIVLVLLSLGIMPQHAAQILTFYSLASWLLITLKSHHHENTSPSGHSCEVPHTFLLQWRHNEHDGVSNHQRHGCLLNRLFRRTSKKTSKLRVTGLCAGNSPGTGEFPHKGPVTRKMFLFGDVIM